MLGAVVLFTALAYVFTPLTAAGEEGQPIAFEWNVRYLAPAAAVGLALLPCLPLCAAQRARRARSPSAGSACCSPRRAARWSSGSRGTSRARSRPGSRVLAAFAAIQLAALPRPLGRPARRSPGLAGLAAVVALGALGAGWWEQRHYLERRYENLSPQLKLADAVRWARDLRDAKVAISRRSAASSTSTPSTAPTSRTRSSGSAIEGPDGAYERIPTCAEWRQALADGGYTHVVTTYDPFNPGTLTDTKEALWTRTDPAAKQILRDGPVSVFELDRAARPGGLRRPSGPEPGRARRRLGQRGPDRQPALSGSRRCSRSTPAHS